MIVLNIFDENNGRTLKIRPYKDGFTFSILEETEIEGFSLDVGKEDVNELIRFLKQKNSNTKANEQ